MNEKNDGIITSEKNDLGEDKIQSEERKNMRNLLPWYKYLIHLLEVENVGINDDDNEQEEDEEKWGLKII